MTLLVRNDIWTPAFNFLRPDTFDGENILINEGRTASNVPAINIYETDNDYAIEVAVPGMSREDFKIQVNEGILTVSAIEAQDVEEEEQEEEGGYVYQEYAYHSFERSFNLPDDINEDAIEAFYVEGELIITIPKTVESVSTAREIFIG